MDVVRNPRGEKAGADESAERIADLYLVTRCDVGVDVENSRHKTGTWVAVGVTAPVQTGCFGVHVEENEIFVFVSVGFVRCSDSSRLADDTCNGGASDRVVSSYVEVDSAATVVGGIRRVVERKTLEARADRPRQTQHGRRDGTDVLRYVEVFRIAMRVIRGRGPDRDADRRVTAAMLRDAGETGEPAFRAWTPHRQIAFGRRDTRAERYDEAAAAADARGFPPVERSVGGRAVAYTGTTVAFAHAVPLDDARTGLDERYEAGTSAVVRALRTLGVPARRGEPPKSYCPGDHSVQAGGKLCGIAQRVRKSAALVSGVVVVADRDEIADILVPIYDALDVPFDPDSVGSVATAGGPASSDDVCQALESVFVGDAETRVEDADDVV